MAVHKIPRITLLCMYILSLAMVGCNGAAKPVSAQASAGTGLRDGIYAIDTYKLKFTGDHYTLLTQFDQEWAQGTFLVQGDRIVFTDQDFAPECGPGDSPYSYQWAFDGKSLTFSNPDDKCMGRISFLTENPWVLTGQK